MTEPATPTLPPNTVQLYDFLRPGLDDGKYTIEADHVLAVTDAVIPSASQSFTVQGPRFTLEPAEVHAVYPPANSSGDYGDTLPHVVLSTRTLPWERALARQERTVPWLALLVFDAGEVAAAGPASPTGAATMKVGELAEAGGRADLHVPGLADVSKAEGELTCQTLTIPATLFLAVAPRLGELHYLAHVRQIDVGAQPGTAEGEIGWFAVVVANRMTAATAGGARAIAHLVSLEGHETLLETDSSSLKAVEQVRLVSLASWSFSAVAPEADPDTDGAGESFGQLAKALATARPGERADLALGLPFEDTSSLAADDAAGRRVAERLAQGYVPVAYRLRTGEDTFAWYRGPLTPQSSAGVDESARPFESSSAALVYDETTGLFDISLATAWELGRAMALADRKFTVELVRFRRRAHRLVDLVLAGLQTAHLDIQDDLAAIAKGGAIEQRFLHLLGDGLIGTVAKMSGGAAAPPAAPPPADAGLPEGPVAAVKALLQREDVQAFVAEELADDRGQIADWLARLGSLQGVPFLYLVAHPKLLPIESARFFTLDRNWIGALVDGALSVGVQSRRDSWFQPLIPTILPVQPSGQTVTGLLVRSAVVSGWPGLTVEAGTVAKGQDAEQPATQLRSDRLAPDVLLCLFQGAPNRIRLTVPHQGLHFALESGCVHVRGLGKPLGKPTDAQPLDVVNDPTLWRTGADRVLNIAAPKNGAAADLVGRIRTALALDANADFGSADFALQMLSAPEQLTFTLP